MGPSKYGMLPLAPGIIADCTRKNTSTYFAQVFILVQVFLTVSVSFAAKCMFGIECICLVDHLLFSHLSLVALIFHLYCQLLCLL